ncbi:ribonucleases P/MRP protein subunit pop7 [Borealophlyctis nickersoniae]|nr:ribonucleases P/MRP protein subunit pop7 [Borealophlyctis nickersoniae]
MSTQKRFTAPTKVSGLLVPSSRRHKRAPQRAPTLETDIYVSRKTAFAAYCKRAQKIIDRSDFTFLVIRGLGTAITRAIEVALFVKQKNPTSVSWTVTTSTVKLVDDMETEDLDDDVKTETRENSAIHIRIVKMEVAPEEKADALGAS